MKIGQFKYLIISHVSDLKVSANLTDGTDQSHEGQPPGEWTGFNLEN